MRGWLLLLLCAACSGSVAAPSNLTISDHDGALLLSWLAPQGDPNGYAYEVEGRVASGAFAPVGGLVRAFPPTLIVGGDPLLPDQTPLTFRVRAVQGTKRSAWSNEASFVVRKPFAQVGASPSPGGRVAPSPFVAELELSLPIDPASVDAQHATFIDASGRPLPTTPSLSPDGRTVRLVLDVPLEGAGAVQARADVRDRTGRAARAVGGGWAAWRLRVFDPNALVVSQLFTNVSVSIELPEPVVYGAEVAPASARLYAGALKIADLGAPPWPAVVWDTRGVPEGAYPISVQVPGFASDGHWGDGPTVHVDRTPAHATCTTTYGQSDQLGVSESITIQADEPLLGATPTLSINGVAQPVDFWPSAHELPGSLRFGLHYPTPFTAALTAGAAATDLAGNPVIVSGCTFHVPQWLAPWGAGALAAGSTPVRATALALSTASPTLPAPDRTLALSWIASGGDVPAGSLLASGLSGSGPAESVALLNGAGAVVSSFAISGSHLAWTERAGAGPGQVRTATHMGFWYPEPGALNFDPSHDADHVAASGIMPFYSAPPTLAWSEDDGAGGRTIRARSLSFGSWAEVAGDVRAAAGSIADFPSLSANFPGTLSGTDALLAFLEKPPAGVPQVRIANALVQFGRGSWTQVAGSLNADPSAAASEPSAWAFAGGIVAWVEGGKVLARTLDFQIGLFGAAQVLNADATHAARSPRATSDGVVVFVEAGANGDEIWVRRWDGVQWTLLSGPLNAGATGPVTALSVAPGPAIGWIDGTGAVRVRLGNW